MSVARPGGKLKLCRTCRERPRASALVPWCSAACRRAEVGKKKKSSTTKRQRAASRKKREELTDLRPSIVSRDHGRCRWCGSNGEHVHHVLYRSQGGPHAEWNLILLCHGCHDLAHANKRTMQDILLKLLLGPANLLGKDIWPEIDDLVRSPRRR